MGVTPAVFAAGGLMPAGTCALMSDLGTGMTAVVPATAPVALDACAVLQEPRGCSARIAGHGLLLQCRMQLAVHG